MTRPARLETGSSVLAGAEFVEQLRNDGEQVADDAEVGDFVLDKKAGA